MKNTKRRLIIGGLCLMIAGATLLTACTNGSSGDKEAAPAESAADRDVIYQVSLLQGLTYGDYNGSVPVGRLKELGDIGIGTFDGLNGELIMLDGTVYRAAYDGSVEVVPDEENVPFANVTFFDADEVTELGGIDSVKT